MRYIRWTLFQGGFVRRFDVNKFCKNGAEFLFILIFGFLCGYYLVELHDALTKEDSPYYHCSANDVDEYYFQKLEKFVDPRDSNEYMVLKFAGYKGCGSSELDSGFLAGDTVTFHLFVENLRYKTKCSKCLDSTCERGRYYPFAERSDACPPGWTVASAIQNAGLHFWNGRMTYYPTFRPKLRIDSADPSGLKSLRSHLHEKNNGLVENLELNLSGFYNIETERFEYVDSLSIVWTSDAFATVIPPNDYSEDVKKWATEAMDICRLKPENLYPIRCIRIDDPKHIMDDPKSGMETYYHNMRMLPYLFK